MALCTYLSIDHDHVCMPACAYACACAPPWAAAICLQGTVRGSPARPGGAGARRRGARWVRARGCCRRLAGWRPASGGGILLLALAPSLAGLGKGGGVPTHWHDRPCRGGADVLLSCNLSVAVPVAVPVAAPVPGARCLQVSSCGSGHGPPVAGRSARVHTASACRLPPAACRAMHEARLQEVQALPLCCVDATNHINHILCGIAAIVLARLQGSLAAAPAAAAAVAAASSPSPATPRLPCTQTRPRRRRTSTADPRVSSTRGRRQPTAAAARHMTGAAPLQPMQSRSCSLWAHRCAGGAGGGGSGGGGGGGEGRICAMRAGGCVHLSCAIASHHISIDMRIEVHVELCYSSVGWSRHGRPQC